MWMDKLSAGVLRVLTPMGPRYIMPSSLSQRMYLLWIFRHFHTLPLQVLSRRQRRMVDALCAERNSVVLPPNVGEESLILGTVERRPPVAVEAWPPRRPAARVADSVPLVADMQQRS